MVSGYRIWRSVWDPEICVVYQKGYPLYGIPCNAQTAAAWGIPEGSRFKCDPYFQIRTIVGSHAMWTPTNEDILARDWEGVRHTSFAF